MKKLITLLLMVATVSISSAREPMKMVYFDNFPPYSWLERGEMKGILIDVMDEALQKRMGIAVIHRGYPWERAQNFVKNGEGDAFVTVPTPKRMTYTRVSKEPVVKPSFTMFVNKDSLRIDELRTVEKISDLKKFRLGHYLGSGWAQKNLAGMDVDWTPNSDTCLMMLGKGRFDVFVDVSQVIRYNIKLLGLQKQITEIPTVLDSSTFNLCIGKQSAYASILPKFDETIRKMGMDGTLQRIYDKYR